MSIEDVVVGGRRFKWVETLMHWDAAQANCKKLGGTLATGGHAGDPRRTRGRLQERHRQLVFA
jgi:hypothetical protein